MSAPWSGPQPPPGRLPLPGPWAAAPHPPAPVAFPAPFPRAPAPLPQAPAGWPAAQPPPGALPLPPPQPGWGQPPAPPVGWGAPPARPRRGRGGLVAVVVVGVVAVLGLGLVIVTAQHGDGTPTARSTYSPPSNTYTYTPLPAPTSSRAPVVGPTTTTAPTTLPRTTPPRTTEPPAPATTEPPAPATTEPPAPVQPQPVLLLGDNPLMVAVGLPAVSCSWPAWARDPAAQQAFNQGVVACLGQAWQPVLAARGLPFSTPTVIGFDGTVSSPCGAGSAADTSFYCGANTTFYSSNSHYADVERVPASAQAVFIETAAHEYGHHVQHLSGILDAYARQRYDAGPDTDAGLLLSRRTELQAQCFSGMFFAATLGVIGQGAFDQAQDDSRRRGDSQGLPRDHGTPERVGAWFGQGGTMNSAAQCNTWTSAPDGVQ